MVLNAISTMKAMTAAVLTEKRDQSSLNAVATLPSADYDRNWSDPLKTPHFPFKYPDTRSILFQVSTESFTSFLQSYL
jgi:hypothetical protein